MALGSSEATHCTGANGHILCPVLLGMVEMPSVSLPTWESSQVVTHSTDVGLQKNSALESCDLAQLPLQCIVAAPIMARGAGSVFQRIMKCFLYPHTSRVAGEREGTALGSCPGFGE